MIAEERRGAAGLVERLTPEQLGTASLCAGWTVQDVAGHLLMPLVTPLPTVLVTMLRSRFDWDVANDRLTRAVSGRPAAQIAAGLRQHAEHPFRPPGSGFEAPLTDLLVHQQDIRRPLGLEGQLDPQRLGLCLSYVASGKARGVAPARRVAGLRLEATDLDWSAGTGELLRGRGEALLLALSGRRVALDELEGPGAAVLRARCR